MKRTRTILSALAVVLVLVAAGCGSSGGSSDGSSATTTAGGSSGDAKAPVALEGKVNGGDRKDISGDGANAEVEIAMEDDSFRPTYIQAAPGAKVTVALSNQGARPHTFTLDDRSVDQQVAPGQTATVEITVPESGSLRFSCDFHGAMGMQGAFSADTTGSDGASSDPTTTDAPSSSRGGGGY